MKPYFFILLIFLVPLISAEEFGYGGRAGTTIKYINNTNLNSSEIWITNEGNLDNMNDILGSEITNDLGWAAGGGDTWSLNYSFYYNKTTLDNGTWIKNNTSPTFINMTATYGILNFLYDTAGLLTIDLNSRLLYDLASVLSLDFNDRVLYASDGTDKILDWYNVGIADFGNSNITTTGNVSASYYCNSTNCYSVNQFLTDTGGDTWGGNQSNYYNKTLINNNFSLYLPLTGGTLSGNLTILNLTASLFCNSTNCYNLNDFLIQSTGASYNETYANYVIANISNMSYYWNNLSNPSNIVIGSLTPSNLDLTGYALVVTYINGSFGVLNMKAEDWILEGVDLIINQDLYIGGTLYPNATLSRNIGSGALRWNVLWVSNISSENIDNSGKITSNVYCNATGICRDLSGWGSGVDLSLYYLRTEIDNNFSLYYLLTNPYNFVNSTSIGNSTIARSGNFNCSGTNVLQNITSNSSGIYGQCIAQSGTDSWAGNYSNYYNKTYIDNNFSLYYTKTLTDINFSLYPTKSNLYANLTGYLLINGSRIITGNINFGGYNISNIDNLTSNKICNSSTCYTLADLLSTTGDGSYNVTYNNYVIANISNQTYNWITNNLTMNGINTTQLRNVNGYLTIVENWLSTFGNTIWCKLTGCTMTGDLNMNGNNITNVKNISSDYYCNSTNCYTLVNFLTDTGSSDTWSLNYSFYYNKTLIDNNLSLRYLNTNPSNFVNSTTIGNDTIVRNNTSPTFQNLTFMGYNWIDRGNTACEPLPCLTFCKNSSGGLFGNFSSC
jgi:hypothetical protein